MDNQDTTPGNSLRAAAEKADLVDADSSIAISLKLGPNGKYDTLCATCNLTYTQAIGLLEIQKARFTQMMLQGRG